MPAHQSHAHFALHFITHERRVLALALERFRFDAPSDSRIEKTQVGVVANAEVPGIKSQNARRCACDFR